MAWAKQWLGPENPLDDGMSVTVPRSLDTITQNPSPQFRAIEKEGDVIGHSWRLLEDMLFIPLLSLIRQY